MANNVYVRTFPAKGKYETSGIHVVIPENVSDDEFRDIVDRTEHLVDIARQVDALSREGGSYQKELPPAPKRASNSLGVIEYLEDEDYGWVKVPFEEKDNFKELRDSFNKKELCVKWHNEDKLWSVGSGWLPPRGTDYPQKELVKGTMDMFLDAAEEAGFQIEKVRRF